MWYRLLLPRRSPLSKVMDRPLVSERLSRAADQDLLALAAQLFAGPVAARIALACAQAQIVSKKLDEQDASAEPMDE